MFKKYKRYKPLLILITLSVAIFFVAGISYALDSWNAGFRINTETKNVYVGPAQTCYKVTNTSGNSYFIPTNTVAEWNSFSSYKPAGVSIDSCGNTHTDGYGHTWVSQAAKKSQQAAIEACQHFYSDNPCQCGVYTGGYSALYATYANNCHVGAPGFSGHTCCNRAWEISRGNMYSWVFSASGWCGWWPGWAGDAYSNCSSFSNIWY